MSHCPWHRGGICANDERQVNFDEDSLDTIFSMLNAPLGRQFETIKYQSTSNGHSYEFIWKNNFTNLELNTIFKELKNKNNQVILSESSLKNLIKFVDNVSEIDDAEIDVSLFENLTSIELKGIGAVYGLSCLKNLESLSITAFNDIEIDVRLLKQLKKIETTLLVSVKNMNSSVEEIIAERISDSLQNVKRFTLRGNATVVNAALEMKASSLEELTVGTDTKADTLNLQNYPKLRKLTLISCMFNSFKNIDSCVHLEEISIEVPPYCEGSDLANPAWLPEIIDSLCKLPKLNKVKLSGFENVIRIDLSGWNLRELELISMRNLSELIGINNHPTLEKLSLINLLLLPSFKINGAKKLRSIEIYGSDNFLSISGVKECPSLLVVNARVGRLALKTDFIGADVPWVDLGDQGSVLNDGNDYCNSDNEPLYSQSREESLSNVFADRLPIYSPTSLNDEKKLKSNPFTSKTLHSGQMPDLVKIFSCASKQDNEPDASHYRNNLFNIIDVDDDKLMLVQHYVSDFKPYAMVNEKIQDEKNIYHAAMPGPFLPNKQYILYGLSTKDKLLSIEEKDRLDISYSAEQGLYQVSLKPNSDRSLVTLHYTIKTDPHYFITHAIGENDISSVTNLYKLPDILKTKLADILDLKFNQLIKPSKEFLDFTKEIKKAIHPYEKLNAIIKFCKKFKNKELAQETNNGIYDFLATLWEAKGVCAHMTKAFVVLCQYFGFPVRANATRLPNNVLLHEFPELYVNTPSGPVWKGLDLGGVEVVRKYVSSHLVKPKINEIKKDEKTALNISAHYHQDFLPDLEWLEACHNIKDVVVALEKTRKPPLIRYSNKNDAYRLHT